MSIEVTSRSMPTYLKVTAWWGGQAGSLVFWSWLMSAFASLVTLRKWDRDREFLPWVIVVTSITTAFFLGLVVFYENPFARFWQTTGRAGHHEHVCPAERRRDVSAGWARSEPAAAASRHDHPSADALSRLRFLCDPLRLCHGRADHRSQRRSLDPAHAPLDVVGMAVPLLRTRAGQPLGIRCARLGRLLGLGPG